MTRSILLVGGGGHCESCIDVIESSQAFPIAGVVEKSRSDGSAVLGYNLIGDDTDLERLVSEFHFALVTVGQIKTPDIRIRLYEMLRTLGADLPVIVSPRAHRSKHCEIGEGTILMHDSIINAGAHVGVNCIINTKALVEHGATVRGHCHISTGAIVNGMATIGEGSFIGSGAVICENVHIGSRCVIGAGSLVRHDVPSGTRFVGGSTV